MSESPTPEAPKPPNAQKLTISEREPRRARFRRAARWLLKWSFRAVVIALVVGLLVLRGFYYAGQRGLRAEEARLDAEDPGWRAEELIAARNAAAPPDERNSARVVFAACASVPREWHDTRKQRVLGCPTALNRKQVLADLHGGEEGVFANMRESRDSALRLTDLPSGCTPLPAGATLSSHFPQFDSANCTAAVLQVEALDAATRGDVRRALRATRALLNVGRSFAECPTSYAAHLRFTTGMVATSAAASALALCDTAGTEDELAALQAALARELDEPVLVHALRGERALGYRTITDSENRPSPEDGGPEFDTSFSSRANRFVERSFLPEARRRYLAGLTEIITAAQGPPERFRAVVVEVQNRPLTQVDSRYKLGSLMLGFEDLARTTSRHRALLGSTVALLACERFRLKNGRFPNALAELPKELLASVPLDPYTGAPLTFARTPNGITVLAHPPARELPVKPPGAVWLTAPLGGDEFGWRLFELKQRGLPPLP